MGQNVRVHEAGGPSEMERLAERLIKRLGVEGALRSCRENHWDGVLKVIQLRFRGGPI